MTARAKDVRSISISEIAVTNVGRIRERTTFLSFVQFIDSSWMAFKST